MKDALDLIELVLSLWDSLRTIASSASFDHAFKLLGAFALVIGAVIYQWGRIFLTVGGKVVDYFSSSMRLRAVEKEVERVKTDSRWVRSVSAADLTVQRRMKDSIPILLIANQKGGVGKTTLAANIGAYFALHRSKRVLFVDLDFQATLSTTLRKLGSVEPDEPGRVSNLLSAEYDVAGKDVGELQKNLFKDRRGFKSRKVFDDPGDLHYSAFFDSSEALSDIEDWLMLKWAIGLDKADVRFQLARFLQSPGVQKYFDLVILDSPPRNTTAGINGLCACTDILIPTKADQFSWRGALRYLVVASRHHDLLCPNARLVGFVGTMTPTRVRLPSVPESLREPLASLEGQTLASPTTGVVKPLASYWPSNSSFDYLGTLATRQAIADDAGENITYITEASERPMIREIGDAIWKKLYPGEARETERESA